MTNSQKYKTVEERTAACSVFLVKHSEYEDIPYIEAAMRWLELEAEKEEPLPCPFCGAECRTVKNRDEAFVVGCDMCCYASQDFESKDDAIAAHNRVARAALAEASGEEVK